MEHLNCKNLVRFSNTRDILSTVSRLIDSDIEESVLTEKLKEIALGSVAINKHRVFQHIVEMFPGLYLWNTYLFETHSLPNIRSAQYILEKVGTEGLDVSRVVTHAAEHYSKTSKFKRKKAIIRYLSLFVAQSEATRELRSRLADSPSRAMDPSMTYDELCRFIVYSNVFQNTLAPDTTSFQGFALPPDMGYFRSNLNNPFKICPMLESGEKMLHMFGQVGYYSANREHVVSKLIYLYPHWHDLLPLCKVESVELNDHKEKLHRQAMEVISFLGSKGMSKDTINNIFGYVVKTTADSKGVITY